MGHGEQLRLGTVGPREAIDEGAALVAQDGKGHAKKLRLGNMRRAYEKLLIKVQPSSSRRCQNFGDAITMG